MPPPMLEVWVSPFVADIQLTYELCQVGFLIMSVPHCPQAALLPLAWTTAKNSWIVGLSMPSQSTTATYPRCRVWLCVFRAFITHTERLGLLVLSVKRQALPHSVAVALATCPSAMSTAVSSLSFLSKSPCLLKALQFCPCWPSF